MGVKQRILLLALAAASAAAAHPACAQQVQVSGANRTLAVTTTAQAGRRADTATVHIGFELYGANSGAVTDEAGSTSKAVAGALLKIGLPKDAVQSEAQSTGPVPVYQENGESPQQRAERRFEAQQSWTVRTAAGNAAKVLAAATAAGANQSGAVDWSVVDEDALTAEAAGNALKQAKEIAVQMAAGLGAKLGELVYASNEAQAIRVLHMTARAQQDNFATATVSAAAETVQLSLSPPMVTRSATVSAVFAIQ